MPKVVRNDAGVDEWVFQGQTTSTPFGMAATVGWPREEWGFNPGALLRAAAGLLRRARAGARHERQRRARVDELPDDGRVQRPHLHRGRRQGDRARHAPGVQRLGDRRVVRRLPRPLHPAGHRADVGRRPRRRGGAPSRRRRAAGRSASSRRRTSQGFPSFLSGYWDPMLQAHLRREHGAVAAHRRRVRGHPAPAGGADRPPHGAGVPDQRHHRAGPALRSDAAPVPRPARSRSPRAGSAGSRSTSTASTATSRTRAGCTTATTSAASCPSEVFREHILACYITDPSGLLLRDRIGIDIIAWECDYPHTDTTWPRVAGVRLERAPGRRVLRRGDPQDHLGERVPVLRRGRRG